MYSILTYSNANKQTHKVSSVEFKDLVVLIDKEHKPEIPVGEVYLHITIHSTEQESSRPS